MDHVLGRFLSSEERPFVFEVGGGDGERLSNSLFFERVRGFDCLLVEPVSSAVREEILPRQRNCAVLEGALWNGPTEGNRDVHDMHFFKNGLGSQVLAENGQPLSDAGPVAPAKAASTKSSGNHSSVLAYPLNLVLKALNRTVIDLWFLDVERSEIGILQNFDFQAVEVGYVWP